jgi:phage-related protein
MRKIERLIFTNEHGESVEFSHASVYYPTEVSGLSDIRSTAHTVSSMGQDGETYLGSRIESRDIEIVGVIKEQSREKAREYRRELGHVLNPHAAATLTYIYGDFTRVIDCHVNNAPFAPGGVIFKSFTVQLNCPNPFWREADDQRTEIAAWNGSLEFTEPDGLEIFESAVTWEIGYRQPSLIVNAYNAGDVKSGMRIDFKATGTVMDPSLLNIDTREFIQMIGCTLQAGDVISVFTHYGEKRVELKKNGQVTDASYYLDPDSAYLQLEVGNNMFRYNAANNLDGLEVTIYHNNLYLGV